MTHPNDPSGNRASALIIVDVQPTFCEGGELPVPGGNAVASRIARHVRDRHGDYAVIATTQDWHVDPGAHFADNPDFVDTWPPHGIAGTANAELHPDIASAIAAIAEPTAATERAARVVRLKKGAHAAAYSGFEATDDEGRDLRTVLEDAGAGSVEICGLAESHCVKSTAIDAARLGYATTVLSDLTAPVTEQLGEQARDEMSAAGVRSRRTGQLLKTSPIRPKGEASG